MNMPKILDVYPCPICKEIAPVIKEWEIKGRVQAKGQARGTVDKQRSNTITIKLYKCQNKECTNYNKTFRKGFSTGGDNK